MAGSLLPKILLQSYINDNATKIPNIFFHHSCADNIWFFDLKYVLKKMIVFPHIREFQPSQLFELHTPRANGFLNDLFLVRAGMIFVIIFTEKIYTKCEKKKDTSFELRKLKVSRKYLQQQTTFDGPFCWTNPKDTNFRLDIQQKLKNTEKTSNKHEKTLVIFTLWKSKLGFICVNYLSLHFDANRRNLIHQHKFRNTKKLVSMPSTCRWG